MIKPSDRAWFQGVRWLEVQIVNYLRNSSHKGFIGTRQAVFSVLSPPPERPGQC